VCPIILSWIDGVTCFVILAFFHEKYLNSPPNGPPAFSTAPVFLMSPIISISSLTTLLSLFSLLFRSYGSGTMGTLWRARVVRALPAGGSPLIVAPEGFEVRISFTQKFIFRFFTPHKTPACSGQIISGIICSAFFRRQDEMPKKQCLSTSLCFSSHVCLYVFV
jgi:hypothetical protein